MEDRWGDGPIKFSEEERQKKKSQSGSRGGAQKEDRGLACWVVMSSSTCGSVF